MEFFGLILIIVMAIMSITVIFCPYFMDRIIYFLLGSKPNKEEQRAEFARLKKEVSQLKEYGWEKTVKEIEGHIALLQKKNRSQLYINSWLKNKLLRIYDI